LRWPEILDLLERMIFLVKTRAITMQFDRDGSVFYAAGGVPPGVPPAASDEPCSGISARRA